MKLTTLALSAIIVLWAPGLAHGQTNGFPDLPPVKKTGSLPNNPGTTFTFIVAGDNRPNGNTPVQPKILSQIFRDAQQYKPAFFLWCGDTISGHTKKHKTLKQQYDAFITAALQAKAPIFNAPGNHEMDLIISPAPAVTIEVPNPQMLADYLKYMRDPPNTPPYAYGAFNFGNSRFIAMNTEEVAPGDVTRSPGRVVASGVKLDPGYVSPEQIALLTQDLENNKSKDHIFIFMHHPLIPNNILNGLNLPTALQLQKLFASYPNVSYVLAAHEHLYYNASANSLTPSSWTSGKSQPSVYLVTGGAGAPLDKCVTNTGYCAKINHYLVFTVNGDTDIVTVKVVQMNSSSTKKNGGEK
jgi:hypothetical protein